MEGIDFKHYIIHSFLALTLAKIRSEDISSLFCFLINCVCVCVGAGSGSPGTLLLATKRGNEMWAANSCFDYFSSRKMTFKFHVNTGPPIYSPGRNRCLTYCEEQGNKALNDNYFIRRYNNM